MSDKTHCGHDPRYIVQADEGTAYCALCELEAARKEILGLRAEIDTLNRDIESDLGETGWME